MNDPEKFDNLDDALAHYGIKGMRWGHRKDDESGGDSSGGADAKKTSVASAADVEKYFGKSTNAEPPLGGSAPKKSSSETASAADVEEYFKFAKTIQKDLADQGIESADLQQKYGPPTTGEAKGGLTPTQKKLIIGAGIGLAGAAAIYYAKQNGVSPDGELKGWGMHVPENVLNKTRQDVYGKAMRAKNNGLEMHWDQGVELPKGHIFKRVSTVKETEIRPEGFYAAFDPNDVDRYKAILPTFWRQWGVGTPEGGGFVNNYQAGAAIKAPSGKETMAIFKDLVANNKSFRDSMGISDSVRDTILKDEGRSAYSSSRMHFSSLAQRWAIPPDQWGGSQNRIFFDAVKARGYNALIDFNDAGALSNTPLRTLDGSLFDIVSHEPLGITDMLDAAGRVRESIAHMLLDLYEYIGLDKFSELMHNEGLDPDDFLAHYGVKGMRWGHRKDPETGTLMKTSREARKDAEEFARAKMFYGEGAGTRRKLIKATVEGKASKDADYKRAFDHHLEKQDMSQHAAKARGERKRKDIGNTTAKTARGVRHIMNGNSQFASLTAVLVAGAGAAFLKNGGIDKIMSSVGSTKIGDLRNQRANMKAAQNLLRDLGL